MWPVGAAAHLRSVYSVTKTDNKLRAHPSPSWKSPGGVFEHRWCCGLFDKLCLICIAFRTLTSPRMSDRNMQQPTMHSSNSPQPGRRGTDSPATEQSPANKDSPAPASHPSPAAEQTEGAAEGSGEAPAEMTLDITSFRKPGEKTFTQRCRLFVGSLPVDISEEEFKNMFAKYGNVNEVFINRERGFGFIRLVCQKCIFLF